MVFKKISVTRLVTEAILMIAAFIGFALLIFIDNRATDCPTREEREMSEHVDMIPVLYQENSIDA
jgi:hypothetical protein